MAHNNQTPMNINSACESDLSAIADIYAGAVLHGTASFELEPPDIAEITKRFQKTISAGHPYLVARIGEEIAGYAYTGPYRPRPAYKWSVENTVYVSPEYQNNGVGTALLKQIIEVCTQLGFRQMIAIIGDSENIGSINLHKKMGFEVVGVNKAVGRKFEMWLDTVTMQRALGSGAKTNPD